MMEVSDENTGKELVGLIRESEIITNPEVDYRILQDARNELAKRQQDKVLHLAGFYGEYS